MNSRQRVVLALGILAVLLLGLFPPCISISESREEAGGHRFVFSLPATEDHSFEAAGQHYSLFVSFRIDYARLAMFLAIVGIVTLGGVVLFRDAVPPTTKG